MARISTYPIISTPTVDDLLIGTDVNDLNITKNFTIGDIGGLIGQDYVPYVGATGNVNLGSFNITSGGFIVGGGTAGQFLKANGTLDSTVYTPQTRTLTINGTTYNLSANRSWDLNTIDTLTTTGTSGAATYIGKVLNIPVYQAQGAYITQLSGEATAVGPGNASVTLSNSAVIGKVLTGLNVTGGTVVSTDTILQAFGKVQNQINGLAGGVEYQGTWNAATNNPFLQSSVGVQGHYYVVNVAGNTNLNGITDWQLGDWAIYNGSAWEKVDNTDAVVSVNGYVGAVVLTSSDVGAVPTTRTLTINGVGYNLSLDRAWTVGDVRTDGSYANPSWITSLAWSKITGTPTTLAGYGITDGALNTRTLTINGTTYDLTANRTWSVGTVTSVGTSGPLTGGTITGFGTIGITQSSSTTDGYLSSADWNAFNSKQEVISVTAPITFAAGVIGITQSSSTVNGYLSSTDWTTFNSKVSGSGTANTIPMWGTGSSLINSPLSYAADTFNFQYNSATGGTVNFTNIGLTAYTYSIQMNNFGSPRSTIHSYTDGLIIQSIGGTQVSRMFANGNLILGIGAVDNGYKLEITGNLYVNSIANATTDTDKFIVSDGGLIKYRTGAEVLSDIGAGTVFSVGLSAPVGFSVSNSPVTSSGTLALSFASGYSLPTDVSQTNWDIAYNNRIASLTTTGTSGAATFISNVLNIPQYQAQGNYITSLTGEATASGPGAASVTLVNSAVTGKVLTGLTVAGSSVVATDSILTAFGKLQGQVNDLIGGLRYEGTWNATTNTPTITSGVGNDGDFYIVSVAGTTNIDGINDWQVGDWIVFHDTAWQKVDNTESVVSVNGFVGAVTLTTSNISEGTNLYFTDGRARTAISLTTTGNSGAATYNNGTGVFNIPQYTLTGLGGVPTTRSLTINGTNFDLSADRTWSVGTVTSVAALTLGTSGTDLSSTVVNGTTTPVITLNVPTASATNRGALSSADWTTFNNKMPAITFNAPLFIASGGDVGITQAGASSNGFLSSTDWTTFNNKQNALTNPVTGTGTTNVVPKFTGTSTIGDSSISDNTNEVSITKRLFLNTGGQSFTITPNLSGVSNRIESSSLPLEITTLGSALRLAAGGVTAQLTLASTGVVTLTNLAGTGSRIVTADASGNLSASSALSGYIQGSGTTNYLPKFTGSTTIGNSALYDGGGFGGFNSTGISSRTFVINAASGRPLVFEMVEFANIHSVYVRPNNSGFNLISSNYISGGVYLPLSLTARENNADLVLQTSGNVTFGSTTDAGFKLDVNGTGRFTNTLNAKSFLPAYAASTLANQNSGIIFTNGTISNAFGFVVQSGLFFQGDNSLINGVFGVKSPTADGSLGNTVFSVSSIGAGSFGGAPLNGAYLVVKGANGVPTTSGTTTNAVFRVSSGTGLYNVLDFGTNENLDYSWIQSTRANSLGVYDKLLIQPNGGNLLVGTTTDNGARLQVSGSTSVAGLLYTTVGNGLIVGGTGFAFAPSSTRGSVQIVGSSDRVLAFGSNGAQDAYIYSAASVTQIVTTPSFSLVVGGLERFNVAASTGAATFSSRVGVGGAAATYSLTAYNASNGTTVAFGGTAKGIRIDNDGVNSSGRSTIFGVDSSFYGSYQPLSIEASSLTLQSVTGGNVGIGSTSPNRKLEVITGNGTTNGIRLTYASGVATEGMDITYLNTGNTTTSFDSLYNSNSAIMQFRMKAAGTAVTAMTILGSGNVGIGTATPAQNLEVKGSSAGVIRLSSTSFAYNIFTNESDGAFYIRDVNNTSNRLTIASTGAATFSSTLDTLGRVTITADSGNEQFTIRRASNTNAQLITGVHSSGYAWMQSIEQNVAYRPLVLNRDGSNVLIATTTDTGDRLRVNGTTFTNEIMTWNPQNDNRSGVAWRLGAATIGTDILNRRLRVNVGGVEYYIGAVEV